MNGPKKFKRKKKVSSCPNPLFAQWLAEWRDEAAEKGIKTQYAYGKALNALKKYPLPLSTGKSCKILENFGDKICSMLDKKLENHIPTQEDPVSMETCSEDEDEYLSVHHKSPRRTSGDAVNSSRRKSQKGIKRPREYIPLCRSGPYAIILTLYEHHKKAGSKGFMTKTELQTEAQQLCDKSFTMPDPGSHYTAWSSMSTLITKGYIHKEGNPARFSITESGCELAHKIQAVDGQQPSHDALPRSVASSSSSLSDNDLPILPCVPKPSFSHETPSHQREDAIPVVSPDFWYIDEDGQRVRSKDNAVVDFGADMSVGFLIEGSEQSLRKSGLRYRPASDRPARPGRCFAFLHNDDAPDTCPAKTSSVVRKEQHTKLKSQPAADLEKVRSKPVPSCQASRENVQATSYSTLSSSSLSYSTSQSKSHSSYADPKTSYSAQTDKRKDRNVEVTAPPLFTLRPGQFELILCVDNCETAGIGVKDGKGRKTVLLKELKKNGVNLDVRKLQVGDFLWVAREKGSAMPGMLQIPQRRELVLDYVVERKRMDDLCSSIRDGRFKEQKFRLKQCGLSRPIYLVEEFGSADHMSLPAATLYQSTVNTQVIDGFFVKHTKDTKESAAYLTLLTRYLHSLFSEKTLKGYRREDLDGIDVANDISSHEQCCLTFQECNESSVKNKETTVTETFAKQLLQFSGMTAEKALALTQLYPTPTHLLDAFSACALHADREKMLARVKYGHSQRNMGPALSKVVFQHYCTSTALT